MDSNLLHKETDEAKRQLAQAEGGESSESEDSDGGEDGANNEEVSVSECAY